ncbi:MAG: TonB-dependent receptor [Acidobacteriota bacterium]|nr:TonB-dependent receptor [Acidobacteriota bacterium]
MTGLHKLRLVAAVAIGSFVAVSAPVSAGARTAGAGRSSDGAVTGGPAAAASGLIAGVVVDDHGTPLGGAIVSAIGPTAALAISDASGHFALDALPAGTYQLQARKLGHSPSVSLAVDLGAHAAVQARLALTAPSAAPGAATSEVQYPILAAGFAAPPEETAPGDSAASPRETAWRLRHLRRSVLKETDTAVAAVAEGSGAAEPQGMDAWLGRAAPLGPRSNGLLDALSGQINLLTVGSLDSPLQVFSADGFSHGVAYLSIHSSPGSRGVWSVRGAMTEGDFASWVLSGAYVARAGEHHRYDVGMFYGAQQPDRSSALAASQMLESGRNLGSVHADDLWTLSPRLSLAYGADYVHYDYAGGRGLLDPRAAMTLTPARGFRIRASASRHSLAPGSEELMLPTSDGIWLPPQHAFAVLAPDGLLKPERTTRYAVGVEHDLGKASTIGVDAFYQQVNDQFVTLFGLGDGAAAEATRYFVADSGSVTARGWRVEMSHAITSRVHGSVAYTVSTADWRPGTDAAMLAALAPAAARQGSERLQDLSTSLETDIPQTATHVLMLYRINTGFADHRASDQPALGYRFDVRVTQGLPFLDFSGTQWQALVAVRNFFRDTALGGSTYDELLVIRPPKRIVGGIMLRF